LGRPTDDLRIRDVRPLIPPAILLEEIPLSERASNVVSDARAALGAILRGDDPRVAVVAGPCSIHDPAAALDYARRLKALAAEVADLDMAALRGRIASGEPVILLVDLGVWAWSRPHYLLAYGMTPEGVVANSGETQGKVIPYGTLDAQWAKMGHLAIVVPGPGK
jgi:hypothetical protein